MEQQQCHYQWQTHLHQRVWSSWGFCSECNSEQLIHVLIASFIYSNKKNRFMVHMYAHHCPWTSSRNERKLSGIWGSHSSKYEDGCLGTCCLSLICCKYLWNVGELPPHYMALQLRRQRSMYWNPYKIMPLKTYYLSLCFSNSTISNVNTAMVRKFELWVTFVLLM
jgi:hypothetical protein